MKMKKNQKKLGNKGFSLVELIVVIAIMAVLVGVLAPTLIRNVEKSRESTDLQNLDTVRGAIVTALSSEKVDTARAQTAQTVTITGGTNTITGATADGTDFKSVLSKELADTLTSNVTMKSTAGKRDGGNVTIAIAANGAVTVYVVDSGDTGVTVSINGADTSVSKCGRTDSDEAGLSDKGMRLMISK